MIESRCGICCSSCNPVEAFGVECLGCIKMEKPFWGNCPVKECCEKKQYDNCGRCEEIPCQILNNFAFDKENGDDGERINQCKKWCGII